MQFIALSRRQPGTTQDLLAPHATEEANVAWQLHTEGVLRSVHICPDRPGSVIILECQSLSDAEAALARLPMVKDGLITFDVSRMIPYTGWAALFRDGLSA